MVCKNSSIYFFYIIDYVVLTLDDVHAEEMADIVSHINNNSSGKSHLNAIFKEADNTGEGNGEVLKAMWSEASDRAAFYKDQSKNSKMLQLNIQYN